MGKGLVSNTTINSSYIQQCLDDKLFEQSNIQCIVSITNDYDIYAQHKNIPYNCTNVYNIQNDPI